MVEVVEKDFLSFYSLQACDHVAVLQIYRILGKTVVCYPIVFDLSDFYLSQDVMLLIDDIKVSPCCDVTPRRNLGSCDLLEKR